MRPAPQRRAAVQGLAAAAAAALGPLEATAAEPHLLLRTNVDTYP